MFLSKNMKFISSGDFFAEIKKDKSNSTQHQPHKTKMEELKEREKKMLETKSQILRAYLLHKVIPVLSEGILDVCQQLPEDPVDHLANYLEKLIARTNANNNK
jgi:hypothetical protein